MKRQPPKPGPVRTLIITRSSSGTVLHGPFTEVDHRAWVELESRGLHVEFQMLDDQGRNR